MYNIVCHAQGTVLHNCTWWLQIMTSSVNFVELYVWGKSLEILCNFIAGVMQRNNYTMYTISWLLPQTSNPEFGSDLLVFIAANHSQLGCSSANVDSRKLLTFSPPEIQDLINLITLKPKLKCFCLNMGSFIRYKCWINGILSLLLPFLVFSQQIGPLRFTCEKFTVSCFLGTLLCQRHY